MNETTNNTTNSATRNTALMRRIMYRTYYAFVIHAATRPLVRYGVPLALLVYLTAKLVFVAAIIANAKAVGVANLHLFAYGAITHTDLLTLVVSAALFIVFVGIARDAANTLASKQLYA